MNISQWLGYPAALDRMLSMVGIELHWVILQYVLGLPLIVLIALLIYAKTKNEHFLKVARTSVKALGIVFAVGAASGTLSEFGLVVIWPNLLEAAGRYIFFPLYVEIFAFLIEIIFIYSLVFGWNKLGTWAKVTFALLALFGAWFSGALIMSVNSYMVAPTGIFPAYDPFGGWKYDQGYPKVLLVIPDQMLGALEVDKLKSLGMEVIGRREYGVAVLLPSKIVSRLVSEAWGGVKVEESVLSAVIRIDALEGLKGVLVKDVIDAIVTNTVRSVGYTVVTFVSPVFFGSVLHAWGSAVTVTGFTVMGAYSLLLLRTGGRERDYYLSGLKFGLAVSLIAVISQGLVFGHALGTEIAKYNPEKLAAMEGVSGRIFSLSKSLGIEGIMSFISYGSWEAKLPNYDAIPTDYCTLAGVPRVVDCRPPIMIHYLYYTKTGLSVLLGLYSLVYAFMVFVKGIALSPLTLKLNVVTPLIAQLVSFLGWAVREMGRKPWSIYGVMTVDVAHTANPGDPLSYALLSLLLILVGVALTVTAWKLLYEPSVKGV
mgnify:CR=1 FL=1